MTNHSAPAHDVTARALRSPQLVTVRRRIFRQLIESLIYEGVLKARRKADGHAIVEGVDEHGTTVSYLFTLLAPAHAFARTRIGPEPVLRSAGGRFVEAESLTRFLTGIREQLGASTERLVGFARELEETLVKDTVAQCVRAERGDRLNGAGFDALEGMVMDGHPYHPAYKSRIGFGQLDNLRWGPEFAAPVRPLWIAAHRRFTTVSPSHLLEERAYLAAQLGPSWTEFTAELTRQGLDSEDYGFLPVHPWQWQEAIVVPFAQQIRDQEIVLLGPDPHEHLAQQSIRTLSCHGAPERDYLKLSLSILNTSTSRVLAPHTVANAARISDWLRETAASDPYLRDELRVILLGEVLGVSVDPEPVSELVRDKTYGALACVWRESLYGRLDEAEEAVPYTALIARELDGTPMIDPWVKRWGVDEWVRRLLEVSVTPLTHFLQGHGIAIESHAQNMVLVHRHGMPTRVALRDFHDGVRFSRAHLARPDHCPELAATPSHHGNRNSFVETDDLGLVSDFFLDAFFFINLGELAMFLESAYGYAEVDFWARVHECIATYQARFPELAERFELFDITKPTLDVEQLTARRLLPDTELRLHAVSNPLSPESTERKK